MNLYGIDLSFPVVLLIILVILRVFLPGIIKPLRPRPQQQASITTISRLKMEDLEDDKIWPRIQWLIDKETMLKQKQMESQAGNWMKNFMGRPEE